MTFSSIPSSDELWYRVQVLRISRVLLLLSFFLITAYSFRSEENAIWLLSELAPPFVLIVVILWFCALSRSVPMLIRNISNADKATGFAMALLLTFIVYDALPPAFRTLSDETNLLAISKSIYEEQTANNVLSSVKLTQGTETLHSLLPQRPLLFPVLTSILHYVFGFEAKHSFSINFGVFFSLLLITYFVFLKWVGRVPALIALFLVSGHSFLMIFGTSGNFDLFHAVMFFGVLFSLNAFLLDPTYFSLFWTTLLAFSHIRPESIGLFLFLIPALLFLRRIPVPLARRHLVLLSATPLLLSPLIWQHLLFYGKHRSDQIPLFSLYHGYFHAQEFFKALFTWTSTYGFAPWLSCLGVLVGGVFVFKEIKKRDIPVGFWLSAFAILGLLAVYLAHFRGEALHPTQVRYFLFIFILLSCLPVLILRFIPFSWVRIPFLFLAIGYFIFQSQVVPKDKFILSDASSRSIQLTQSILGPQCEQDCLVLSDRPGHFTSLNYSGLHPHNANQLIDRIKLAWESQTLREIIALQRINAPSGETFPLETLDKRIRLETIAELRFDDDTGLKVGKVIAIDGPGQATSEVNAMMEGEHVRFSSTVR